jgi:hypothetical protein
MHQASWYNDLPPEWVIGVSENGWTNNEIGLFWLEHVFDKHTKNRTIGRYRLLILDGHGSHVTPEFDQYCLDHSIIVLCMPATNRAGIQSSCQSVWNDDVFEAGHHQMSVSDETREESGWWLAYIMTMKCLRHRGMKSRDVKAAARVRPMVNCKKRVSYK